jgi:NAD(P)-dependent dehydrogenase (short-subunit alcohol dehydrogenase family)
MRIYLSVFFCVYLLVCLRVSGAHRLRSTTLCPQVNLRGVALGTKHAARAMKRGGRGGCIINTTSIAGLVVNCANSGEPVLVSAGERDMCTRSGAPAQRSTVPRRASVAAARMDSGGVACSLPRPVYSRTPVALSCR